MANIEIINDAFRELGQHGISSGDDSPNGIEAKRAYERGLVLLLESHYWAFALKKVTLAPVEGKMASEFAYSYPLPADALKIVKIGFGYKEAHNARANLYPDVRYIQQGRNILANKSDSIDLTYVAKIEDASLFSASFRFALVYYIAGRLANFIEQRRVAEMDEKMFFYLKQAKRNNEIIRDIESIPDNSWVTTRLSLNTFWED